ncbi:SDR family oxidoreductase [Rhizobium sp. TRM95111]|uniref:SDR family NAD(P)-dependent oxidoreductase n=1 Tax=Rhizobium alarense TaxID=2846851 RepID=UPI001F22506E|nr:SDR family oxidoreductase [Rhizobium alarense]MCF3642270.1 SDR family oxidoreductase [Rhizobium alarense]
MATFADLDGRSVFISGGGSGIGAALVEGFARAGARVAFVDIAEAASRNLVACLAGTVPHAPLFLKADIRDVDALQAAVRHAGEALGGIGVLVNNAARDDRHDIETVTVDYWDENQAVNLRHLFFAAQAALPFLTADGGGSIINFSSIAYLLNMGELPAYTTAKAGIIGLTKSLAGRLGPHNIRVNAVLPGMVLTERQRRLWIDEATIGAMLDKQCLKRALEAQDLVGPCLFLASNLSAGITAQSIIVDGGTL